MAESPTTAQASAPKDAPRPERKAPEARVWPTREEREAARKAPTSHSTKRGYSITTWAGRSMLECEAIPGCPFDAFDEATMLEHLAKAHAALPS